MLSQLQEKGIIYLSCWLRKNFSFKCNLVSADKHLNKVKNSHLWLLPKFVYAALRKLVLSKTFAENNWKNQWGWVSCVCGAEKEYWATRSQLHVSLYIPIWELGIRTLLHKQSNHVVKYTHNNWKKWVVCMFLVTKKANVTLI